MKGSGLLERIVAARRARLDELKAVYPLERLRETAAGDGSRGRFLHSLVAGASGGLQVIAELKRASPSAGRLRDAFAPRELAAELARAGAAALSVLTEPDFFQGEDCFLARARAGAPDLPLLRKDFLVDPWQIWESRRLGADAVLLIAAVLTDGELSMLLGNTAEAGLDALVEVKDDEELHRALDAGADIIGVNARDLDDFSVDLARAERLIPRIPEDRVRVAESGVTGPADLARLREAGFDAALVGTALMRAARPGETLAAWLEAAGKGGGR